MLDHFGYPELGTKVISAIEQVMTEGTCLTPDMGGTATTQQVGDRVAELI